MPRPMVGHNALMAVVCVSVCLSVCLVPDPKSRMEGHSKLKIGTKEAQNYKISFAARPIAGGVI